jgi:hypothetical protein
MDIVAACEVCETTTGKRSMDTVAVCEVCETSRGKEHGYRSGM